MTDQAPSLSIEARVITDRGCQREHNEDSAVFVQPGDARSLAAKGLLALVADGMGGHKAGEVASVLAANVIRRRYYRSPAAPAVALVEAFEEANRRIFEHGESHDGLRGMGTTCTAFVMRRNFGYLAHVGDSRLYLLRDGKMHQMTEDHSLVAELVRQGALTESQAEGHADKNVITRALGTQPEVTVASWPRPLPLRPGDRYLLSTDGLHDLLERSRMQDLATTQDIYDACEHLLEEAKQEGGYDNISMILLVVRGPGREPQRPIGETRKVKVG
ncbi:MAG: Stp1/IreP family PP2C-type Ser/Thr phosphatase [Acidobacteriota bacterium]